MPTPPANPNNRITRPAAKVAVLLSQSENSPHESDEVSYLRVIEIMRSAGGKKLDYATFEYVLAEREERLVRVRTPQQFTRVVEIRTRDSQGRPRGRTLFWGEITQQELDIARDGESVTITGRIEEYHFGPPEEPFGFCLGPEIWDPVSEEVVTAKHLQVAFNPEIKGRVEFNKSSHEHPDEDKDYSLWLDVESVRTEKGREFNNQGEEPGEWTLDSVLKTMQRMLNAAETHIVNFNPFESDLFDDAPKVKDLQLKPNLRLPQYLDTISDAYGYGWYLTCKLEEPEGGGELETTVEIAMFKRGEGRERQVYLQEPGEDLRIARSNATNVSVAWDIASPANIVIGQGSLREHEITVELYRGWLAEHDDKGGADLDKTETTFDPALKDVWRLWVANEAGDYCELRSGDDPAPIPDTPFDFSEVFLDPYLPRRRPLGDCLVRDGEGRIEPVLEYWDEGQETWFPVPKEWGYRVLDDQLGIEFTGATPPAELIAFGEDAKLRLTGTVKEDSRLEVTTEPAEDAPNARTVPLLQDLSSQFHYRIRAETGPLASQVPIGDHGSDERDDTEALQDYLDQVREIEKPADLRAGFKLYGIQLDYEIGDLITKVDGREISLNRLSAEARAKLYLQVTGIKYQFQPEQQTILTVEPLEGVVND